MEILLAITILIFALCLLLYIATKFLRELKSGKPTKLSKGFEARLSLVPIEQQKSEVGARNTNSTNESDE